MKQSKWFSVRTELTQKQVVTLSVMSFIIPLLLWSLISYVPFIWHPKMEISEPGAVSYFNKGMLIDKEDFYREVDNLEGTGKPLPKGDPANPVYLPAPHEVAAAFYKAFTTPPKRQEEKWLHESLWDSIQVIFWGFFLSSLVGVPLGILAGTYSVASKLYEPFIEFFRYLPAPAFGALAVAILGIHDAPKIAIIFIGTFFQQVLVISNTTRRLDPSLLEAALTLGAKNVTLLFRVVVPGIITNVYKDLRILLGWAWTYLIVAELIGTSSGITWFITQQARYKNFDNVFAAIIIIGIIGLTTDILLAKLGKRLFRWEKNNAATA
ncbi:MAG: ABC transporter permease [Gammaproteobacteria bacterium]|nr:ABC transporter permease [Gammaproteobacteria bacterium]